MKAVRGKVDRVKSYPIDDALKLVKETATAKFDESVDVAVNLGIDAKKSDQTVRGSVVLPAGTGKKVRVAVFAQGDKAKAANDAGADIVGFDDLAAKIKEGIMDFDVVIATPDAMRVVGQLGQILGPRGLMPNPKVGTVTAGRRRRRSRTPRPARCSTAPTRPASSSARSAARRSRPSSCKTNLMALIEALNKSRPQGTKGIYLKKISLSSTMGAGVRVDSSVFGQQQTQRRSAIAGSNEFEGTPNGRDAAVGLSRPLTRRDGAPSKTAGAERLNRTGMLLNGPDPAQMVSRRQDFS